LKSIDKLVKELETYWRDRAIRKPVRGVAGDVGAIPRQIREEVGDGVGGLYLDPHLPWDVQIPIEKMPRWVEPVEEYIALQIALFIREPLRHLAHLLTFVIGGAFMILLAITSYPFEPRSVMTISMYGMILSLVAVSVISLIQAERDEVLSKIAKTNPHEINLDGRFIPALLTFGVLPLLGLIFTQVPGMQSVFSWLEPILRALK